MQKVIVSIVYHSKGGHTKQVAEFLAQNLTSPGLHVNLMDVDEALSSMQVLHGSDMILFGCPTYLGCVSARFKEFMEATGSFWYKQLWKDKLAAAFTISSTTNGDKLNTLVSLAIFAAQHSMHWINLGIMPRFINGEQTDGQNRMASYLGLMVQSTNTFDEVVPLHPGDCLTIELFAKRIIDVTLNLKHNTPAAELTAEFRQEV